MSSDINLWETGVNNDGNGTDNNQYYISDSVNRLTIQRGTGNIGIGTDAPLHLLDVRGNINITGEYLLNGFDAFNDTSNYVSQTSNLVSDNLNIAINDTSNYVSQTSNLVSDNLNIAINDTSNYVLQTSNLVSDNLNIAINDTSNYVLQTSNLVSDNLNIAINDTSNYVLQTSNLVSDNLNIAINDTSNYVLQTSNLVSDNLNIAINDTSNYVANLSADEIADGVNNKFIINGIYSNNFEVNGNIKATSIEGTGANITTINADNITSGTLDNARMPQASEILLGGVKVGNNTEINESGNLSVNMSTYTGDVKIIGDLTTSNLTILGDSTTLETNVFTTERLEINNIGTGTGISVTQLGGTDDIFTASNSSREVFNIINNGNVGIGITNPGVSLHVAGTDGIVVPVGTEEERPSESIKGLIRYNTTTLSFEGYGSTWGSLGGVKDVDGDTYISAENNPGDNNDELKFYTSNFERMVITSNGLIGIGTTNPTVELDVNGDIKYSSLLYGPGANITDINTDYITTHNINIINTETDSPSLKITHNTSSNDILQITDTNSKQYLTLTNEGNVGIGTNIPLALLHIYDTSSTGDVLKASDTEITINRSIIPETNDTVDIGSAEKKIRDMYISNNSLWIGDEHKLTITSDGVMKFRKRNKTVLPKTLINASGTNEAAIAHVNEKYGTSFVDISELKLNHILSYAKTINPEYKTSDIFGEDIQDYELDTAADAWQINSSKIFLGTNYTNIGIGTNNPDPYFKLDVAGNVNAVGTISADDITIKGTTEKGSGAIKLNCEYNSHGVTIKGPPHLEELSQNYTLTLPSNAPQENNVLSTDIDGNLSWVKYRLDNLNMVEQNQESIDDLKELLGISTYEITNISPVFLDLTTTTSNKETLNVNGLNVEYMKPITFTIYGKNFDRNVVIKLCLYDDTNKLDEERDINTIYHDSSIQLRVSTKYIPISVINNASYFKLMMYNKNYPEKKILSREIYKDEHEPKWLYDNDYEVIYNKEFGFKFTINDSDTSNILLYELTDGTHLIPDLSFNSETGEITGVPEILNTTVNLSMNAKSGSQFLTTRNYKLYILSNPIIHNLEEQELLVSNTFDLLATSDAESFSTIFLEVNKSITWSLTENGDTDNITLTDNTIKVTNLYLLGDSGTNIKVQATDAYGYSTTKIINIKRTKLNDPTINTEENQELLVSNTFILSATSDVVRLDNPEADTSITWSLTENGDTDNISLSGNTIIVEELDSLGETGTNITIEATDAYNFKKTIIINIKKTFLNGPTINTEENQELLVSNTFILSATSDVVRLDNPEADTSITWSLTENGDTDNISLSGNTIIVAELDSLGDTGTDITVKATDAYGYSITKTINVKKLVLPGPTIHTDDQELLSNTFILSATSAAVNIDEAVTSINWSLTENEDANNISLSGNTIIVAELDSLGDTGTNITVKATDAYGYSSTKIINVKNTSLYAFTSHTFTNAGATGRSGPTLAQCQSSYSSASWTQKTEYFNMTTQGVQLWTVPRNGYYKIECYGARGGGAPAFSASNIPSSSAYGGYGAIIRTFVYFLKNDVVRIVVGQEGGTSYGSTGYEWKQTAGGGGGGSFVYKDEVWNNLYCAAGGGGGAVHDGVNNRFHDGINASGTTGPITNGWSNNYLTGYGSDRVANSTSYGGGGAGWQGDGTITPTFDWYSYYGEDNRGKSKPTWVGGSGYGMINTEYMHIRGLGGFGGGGGVFYTDVNIAGGGGGYTGGYPGFDSRYPGSGGASYFNPQPHPQPFTGEGYLGLNPNTQGKVIITFLRES